MRYCLQSTFAFHLFRCSETPHRASDTPEKEGPGVSRFRERFALPLPLYPGTGVEGSESRRAGARLAREALWRIPGEFCKGTVPPRKDSRAMGPVPATEAGLPDKDTHLLPVVPGGAHCQEPATGRRLAAAGSGPGKQGLSLPTPLPPQPDRNLSQPLAGTGSQQDSAPRSAAGLRPEWQGGRGRGRAVLLW